MSTIQVAVSGRINRRAVNEKRCHAVEVHRQVHVRQRFNNKVGMIVAHHRLIYLIQMTHHQCRCRRHYIRQVQEYHKWHCQSHQFGKFPICFSSTSFSLISFFVPFFRHNFWTLNQVDSWNKCLKNKSYIYGRWQKGKNFSAWPNINFWSHSTRLHKHLQLHIFLFLSWCRLFLFIYTALFFRIFVVDAFFTRSHSFIDVNINLFSFRQTSVR